MRAVIRIALALGLMSGLGACNTAEGLRKDVQQGGEVVGLALQRSGDAVGRAVQRGGSAVKDTAQRVGNSIDGAMQPNSQAAPVEDGTRAQQSQ